MEILQAVPAAKVFPIDSLENGTERIKKVNSFFRSFFTFDIFSVAAWKSGIAHYFIIFKCKIFR